MATLLPTSSILVLPQRVFFCYSVEGIVVVTFYFGFAATSFFFVTTRKALLSLPSLLQQAFFSFFLL
jgi:hypothetical protein